MRLNYKKILLAGSTVMTIVKKLVIISSSGQGLFLTVFVQFLAQWGALLSCPSGTTIIMLRLECQRPFQDKELNITVSSLDILH